MRERLELGETVLGVTPGESGGAITASRKTAGGWSPGLADLRIEGGELALTGNRDVLTLESFRLDIGPIEVPESVLGYPLALTDIHLSIAEPVKMVGDWQNDNDARGNTEVELVLEWSLQNHDVVSPLGSPDLPAVPIELSVTGTGERVFAELRASAPGELWTWANVFRLEDLSLVIAADTQL